MLPLLSVLSSHHAAAIGNTLRTILARASSQLSLNADGTPIYSSSSSSSNGDSGSSSSGSTGNVHVLNNLDWFGSMSFLGFLREIGKHARVSQMLAKDSVGVSAVTQLVQAAEAVEQLHAGSHHDC
jgi:tyrosyl-tRNA synthetase